MKYYRCTPHHGSTVEHGNQCRVSNALDEHLPHLITRIRYWRQAVETGAFLGITDGLIDQLNLVHTSTNQFKPASAQYIPVHTCIGVPRER